MTTSARMRKCRSGNALEMAFRLQLRASLRRRIRFEADDLPGTPDAACDLVKVAVFMHGCFWHGCPAHYRDPKTNAPYWRHKLHQNRARDRQVAALLRERGWTVVVLWEHEMRTQGASRVVRLIRSRLGSALASRHGA